MITFEDALDHLHELHPDCSMAITRTGTTFLLSDNLRTLLMAYETWLEAHGQQCAYRGTTGD